MEVRKSFGKIYGGSNFFAIFRKLPPTGYPVLKDNLPKITSSGKIYSREMHIFLYNHTRNPQKINPAKIYARKNVCPFKVGPFPSFNRGTNILLGFSACGGGILWNVLGFLGFFLHFCGIFLYLRVFLRFWGF